MFASIGSSDNVVAMTFFSVAQSASRVLSGRLCDVLKKRAFPRMVIVNASIALMVLAYGLFIWNTAATLFAGVVVAALKSAEALGAVHAEVLASPTSSDLAASMRDAVLHILLGWRSFGVDRVFAGGLALGLGGASAGPAFLTGVLEPTQQALERRLRVHALRGEASIDDGAERAAALGFIAPLLLALLHQGPLGGDRCRPLDVSAFVDAHVKAFVRAWAPR